MRGRLCEHTFPSGLTASNLRATPPTHHIITPCSPLATPCNFSSLSLPLFLLFSRILRRSPSTSKLSITLSIDILYWVFLGSRSLAQLLRMCAASIPEICSRKCCLTIENCFATPEIAEPQYMLNNTKHLLVECSAAGRGLSRPKCVRGSTDSRNRSGDPSPVAHEPC